MRLGRAGTRGSPLHPAWSGWKAHEPRTLGGKGDCPDHDLNSSRDTENTVHPGGDPEHRGLTQRTSSSGIESEMEPRVSFGQERCPGSCSSGWWQLTPPPTHTITD